MSMNDVMCKKIVVGKSGKLEAKPDFNDHGIYFYPIPDALQDKVREKYTVSDFGEEDSYFSIKGKLGRTYYTGKKDKKDTPIYLRYFIPLESELKQ